MNNDVLENVEEVDFELNRDDQRRLDILGLEVTEEYDSINIENVTYTQLKQLVEEGFVDIKNYPSELPDIENYLCFLEGYPEETRVHGFITNPKYSDYGVYINKMEVHYNKDDKYALQLVIEFANLNAYAPYLDYNEDFLYADWTY